MYWSITLLDKFINVSRGSASMIAAHFCDIYQTVSEKWTVQEICNTVPHQFFVKFSIASI